MSLVLSCMGQSSEIVDSVSKFFGKNPFAPQGALGIDPRQYWARRYLSWRHIRGNGAEIGALHQPLKLYHGATAKYVDRMSVADLRHHYKELATFDLVEPDYVDNGEVLSTIKDSSLDFLVANHFIEHCKNPIKTIETHLSKLRSGGMLFYAVPNRDFTFDKERSLTLIDHIVNDYRSAVLPDQRPHYEEWVRHVVKPGDEAAIQRETEKLMQEDYSIHFHVWNGRSFLDFLEHIRQEIKLPFEIIANSFWRYNPFEVVFILKKTA